MRNPSVSHLISISTLEMFINEINVGPRDHEKMGIFLSWLPIFLKLKLGFWEIYDDLKCHSVRLNLSEI